MAGRTNAVQKEWETLSPLAREIAEGLDNAIRYVRGEDVPARITTLELPDPAPMYDEEEIRAERTRLGLTQKAFARVMNISPKTVEAWEAGTKSPGPPARRLLQILSDEKTLRVIALNAGFNLKKTSGGPGTSAKSTHVSSRPKPSRVSRRSSRKRSQSQAK